MTSQASARPPTTTRPRAARNRSDQPPAEDLRAPRPGRWHATYVAWSLLVVSLELGCLALHEKIVLWTRLEPAGRSVLLSTSAGLLLPLAIGAILMWSRLEAMRRDTPGRARLLFGAGSSAVNALATAAMLGLASQAQPAPGPAIGVALLLPRALEPWFQLAIVVSLGSALALVAAGVAAWFLLDARLRRRIWLVLDAVILVAAVVALLRLPARPPALQPGQLGLAVLRHAITTLAVLRLTARLVPVAFDLVEQLGFRPLVAARHLRAKKSGFLAAISILSVLAVTVSCAALTTTLSVMGGFRNDLKRKILGNNAHVVIDQARGSLEGWAPIVDEVAQGSGVAGAAPFVSGEVMLSSASNLATGILRGIDPDQVGDVIDLPKNLTSGSLEFLTDPHKLTELPPDKLRRGLSARQMLEEIEQLREAMEAGADPDRPSRAEPPATEPAASSGPVLPGIIIGQELARSLRLFVGDEVNVVAPLGTLGPSGPMPKSRPFRVAGIFYSGMYEYDMKYTYVALDTAQRFLGIGDAISGIEVKTARAETAPRVAAELRQRIERSDLRVRDWQELNSQLFGALELEKLAMFIALGIAILVASFCIAGTLTLMVQEKGREVAILKAMGTSDRKVVSVFVIEGGLVGLFGASLGLFLGYMVCFAAENFGIRMNPEVYYIDRLPVHIDPMEFALVGVAAVVVCLLVTVYPALLASRLRPIDALRHE